MEVLAGIICGLLVWIAVMGSLSAGAYERGRRDERNQLPTDISNYLDDQL
jgi:hypothetical protein